MSNLPPTVPVLEPRQFCRESMTGENGTHCLIGWSTAVFGNGSASEKAADAALIAEVQERTDNPYAGVTEFNDDPAVPKTKLAAVWAAAMKRLGYRRRGKVFVLPKAKGATP